MDDLTQLIGRVSEATGADREIDAAIALAIDGFYVAEKPDPWGRPRYGYIGTDGGHVEPGQGHDMLVRHYTDSVDAALALIERVLPGWGFYLRQDKDGCGCGLVYPEYSRVTPAHMDGATPPLAILAALLQALQSQKEGEG